MNAKRLFLIIAATFLIAGCRFGEKKSSASKQRIVCVSKQLTELLFALHQDNKIVGVDLSSTYPDEATKLTTVGYHRLLNAEGIISLEPTVVVHQGDVAPASAMQQVQQVGIPVKVYPAAPTLDSAKILIKMLGKEFGEDTTAKRLVDELEADLSKADAVVKKYTTRPKVLIVHFGRQRNQYFIMGNKGTPNEMINLCGGTNAADTSSFRNLSAEVILRSQPDVILATDFGFDKAGSAEKFAELPGLALTPAAKNGKVFRVEEHDLVYFGPRSGATILKLAALIHR